MCDQSKKNPDAKKLHRDRPHRRLLSADYQSGSTNAGDRGHAQGVDTCCDVGYTYCFYCFVIQWYSLRSLSEHVGDRDFSHLRAG